jgi:hypothetical protein
MTLTSVVHRGRPALLQAQQATNPTALRQLQQQLLENVMCHELLMSKLSNHDRLLVMEQNMLLRFGERSDAVEALPTRDA